MSNLRASLPLETEIESRWEHLPGRCFTWWKCFTVQNSWFGYSLHLAVYSCSCPPHLFIFGLWECCYPLDTTRKRDPGRSGLDGCAHFCPHSVPPSSQALPTASPRAVAEGGMQELPWDALPARVPQPGWCSFQGKSSKDERETRTLQLRSLQYLERYIFLILFNSYLHLEKKDSWQRPFSLWMREVRLSLAATWLSIVFPWEHRNFLGSRHPSLTCIWFLGLLGCHPCSLCSLGWWLSWKATGDGWHPTTWMGSCPTPNLLFSQGFCWDCSFWGWGDTSQTCLARTAGTRDGRSGRMGWGIGYPRGLGTSWKNGMGGQWETLNDLYGMGEGWVRDPKWPIFPAQGGCRHWIYLGYIDLNGNFGGGL